MMKNMAFVCLSAILMLSMVFGVYMERADYLRKIRDLELRLAQVVERSDTFYIRDTIPVWRDRVVEVDRTDYKKVLADRSLLKDLNIRISELEAENRVLLSTRDTVYLRPSVDNDTILSYSDKWVNCLFCTTSGVLDWEVRDSLSTFVSREYRHRFLWWRWGVRGYNVQIVSHNPRCRVEYNEYIKIK